MSDLCESDYVMEDEDFGSESSSPPHKHHRTADDSASSLKPPSQSPTILSSLDIDAMMESKICQLREVVSCLTRDEALAILHRYAWDLTLVQQDWFEDNGRLVCEKSGIIIPTEFLFFEANENACTICIGTEERLVGLSGCGHMFCESCFTQYLENKVRDGQDSVLARCPSFKCPLVVPQSAFGSLCSIELFDKYLEWNRNYFVSLNSREIKWCPNAAGCGRLAVRATSEHVKCGCGFEWCWKCSLEYHVPVSCDLARQWKEKNSSESENVTWILANTKPCPNCRKPIEKNQGCNHMTCPSRSGGCGMEFCWMCLGDWKSHSNKTGGFYKCNLYAENLPSGSAETQRRESKAQLERYMFFFARYMNHHKAGLLALKELESKSTEWMETLHAKLRLEITDLEFIQETLRQVASCRHVLKYTYVYGFYLEKVEEKQLFEYLQKNLEEFTDRLHEYVEKDLMTFVHNNEEEEEEAKSPESRDSVGTARRKFFDLRSSIANQCNVTRKFFRQITDELVSSNNSS